MISLSIHHKTTYRYRGPVAFGPHRLMLRPRESRELRLTGFELTVTPQASINWAHDVWGNTVATTGFHTTGDTMTIDSVARIDLDAGPTEGPRAGMTEAGSRRTTSGAAHRRPERRATSQPIT